jgi:hypothetical protein
LTPGSSKASLTTSANDALLADDGRRVAIPENRLDLQEAQGND